MSSVNKHHDWKTESEIWTYLQVQPTKQDFLILIADDERLMRLQLRRVIEQEGYRVAEATNGEECLAAFERCQPDLVLLDAMMPLMDGFTCCSRLKQTPQGERTPILMITGLEDRESVDLAFEAGAVDFITKPIHWAVLRQRMRRAIEQSRLYQQLEIANQSLHKLASYDSLTGVANRRRFDECLDREWQRMAREQCPLSLVLCDVDCFKAYNDTYGHPAGDTCLRRIAEVLSMAARRPADLVARYGGEEFAVILPNTNREGAVHVAEGMRVSVRGVAIEHKNSSVRKVVTLSLGVASVVPSNDSSPAQLIAAADQGLYQAKTQGRDQLCCRF